MPRFQILTTLCLCAHILVGAHYPLINNAHSGPLFHDRTTALHIEDITRSHATNRVSMCDYRYLWLKFDRPKGFDTLMVGGTVPVIDRFQGTRVAAAVIGRGLPGKGASQDDIDDLCGYGLEMDHGRTCRGLDDLPQEIKNQIPQGYGALSIPAVLDQSKCDFFEDPLSISVRGEQYVISSGGKDVKFATYSDWRDIDGKQKRCFFHEEFQGADMWYVQDKLIDLAGYGTHYIVFWDPLDQDLGEPTTTAKFGAVFGDKGQSEDFDGVPIEAGECSLPFQDFYEQDCHGWEDPWYYPIVKNVVGWPEKPFYGWSSLEGAPCVPSYATAIPNYYECPRKDEGIKCSSLCHNHGFCPAGDVPGAPTENCPKRDKHYDPEGCGETCAWQECGKHDVGHLERGPVGPACIRQCEKESSFRKKKCGYPSLECYGLYIEEGVYDKKDAEVMIADLEADNGEMYVIDETYPIGSATKTILDIAVKIPVFSTLVDLVTLADLDIIFEKKGSLTLFAPTDDAFSSIPTEMVDYLLKPRNKSDLIRLLSYHILPDVFLSSSLTDGLQEKTMEKQKITVSSDPVMINDAKVLTADIIAKNGVIHVIDSVLIPPDFNTFEDSIDLTMSLWY